MKIVLITGGARAGKSRWAEAEAARLGGGAVTYLATAEAGDQDMARRIAAHRAERPPEWITIEEPLDIPKVLPAASTDVVLLDCLTLWVSNLLLAGPAGEASEAAADRVRVQVDAFLAAVAKQTGTLLVVTNEVGLGLVPDNALARSYRDLLGWTNARVAAQAEGVVLMVAGLPLTVR